MPRSTNQTSPGSGTVLTLELISQLITAGRRAQNIILRAVRPNGKWGCPTRNNLFVKKISSGTVLTLELISQLITAGRWAQNFILRAVRLNGKWDCPTLNNLFVKKFQRGAWF